ncbi:methylmalonyl-CoA mutase [Peribacillus deserti]|uniref:Methylmalonyl-CoA mutase n=1 Tax=Peribacillus deserti TaxID=673318 RepID=A0ABS2QJ90_9BACI|nr:methylmalonyl-CoA mutase family protein [Peribacillus deserti]MBM7693230.1 methylmalonyl-CoA mutase [Peribacillus deserti]
MKIEDIREFTFPNPGYDLWKTTAEASLKGKNIDSLKTHTYEDIQLNPIYFDGTLKEELPGEYPFTRGISSQGYKDRPWGITQTLKESDYKALLKRIEKILLSGQNVICFDFTSLKDLNSSAFEELVESIEKKGLPLYLDLKGMQSSFYTLADEAQTLQRSFSFRGVAAEDIISEAAKTGQLPEKQELFFAEWARRIEKMDSIMPGVKSILVKSSVYHNAGANAVQELAMALSLGVEYLHRAEENGLSIETAAGKMIFSFALDSNFFMGAAKLRAARRLWSMIGKSYKADHNAFKMEIHAETSSFTQTYYDSHVNILRSANQAFAAVIGGIQYLEVHPFDSISTGKNELSDRIARNIHFILAEEAHLKYVADPAAGSWYIEDLTDQLTKAAWDAFLEMEDRGGALAILESGWIQGQISKVFEEKSDSVLRRKERIIGTNVYADIHEKKTAVRITDQNSAMKELDFSKYGVHSITPLTPKRLPLNIEEIRKSTEHFNENQGVSLKMGLISLNSLKTTKPRADFISGFFSAAGIPAVQSKEIQSEQAALGVVNENPDIQHFCICGSDSDYENMAECIIRAIKRKYPSKKIYIAGQLQDPLAGSLQQAGLDGTIHTNTSLAYISEIFQDMESEH